MRGSCRPTSGSQPSLTAKTYLRMKPRKNTGIATPEQRADDGQVVEPRAVPAGSEVAERDADARPRTASPRWPARSWPGSGGDLLDDRPPGLDRVAEVERTTRRRNFRYCVTRAGRGRTSSLDRCDAAPGWPALPGGPRRTSREGAHPGEQQDRQPSRIGISSSSRRDDEPAMQRTGSASSAFTTIVRTCHQGEVLVRAPGSARSPDPSAERERRLGVDVGDARQEAP